MRVSVDANQLIKAAYYGSVWTRNFLIDLSYNHELLLSQDVIEELIAHAKKEKYQKKYGKNSTLGRELLNVLQFDVLKEPSTKESKHYPCIRDVDDQAILNAVYFPVNNLEVLITEDKDFLTLNIDHPLIVTPRQFLDWFGMEDV